MIYRQNFVKELTFTAIGIFVVILAVLVSTQAINLLGRAADGRVAVDAVAALIGFWTLGMTPLLLGWSKGDPTFSQPMAAAVVSGLITSTLLSLVVIPVVYTLMDDLGRLLRRRKA